MKKLSYYLGAAASLALAVCMSMSLSSCAKEDNPSGDVKPSGSPKVVFKEINIGGGFKKIEDGKSYSWCKAITLYNNSDKAVTLKNLAMGAVPPANAHAPNNYSYDESGKLKWAGANYTPVWATIWYIPEITIQPYSDAVIAVNGAIDHSAIATGAFDLSNAGYAMYDPESGLNNASAYPTPSASIPASNYWKAIMFGSGNAWAVSIMSPALILFEVPATHNLADMAKAEENFYYDGQEKQSQLCIKIPNAWILDGVEFYRVGLEADSKKRLDTTIDAGYGLYNSNKQYSAYRNVDKTATEAIAENAGKLVYDYDQAVEGTNDPSSIDAAASIKNGAKIVYQDTNNSSADFHLRKTWSLK
jgi:hypothetical protein